MYATATYEKGIVPVKGYFGFAVYGAENINVRNINYPLEIICADKIECGACYCDNYLLENANPKSFKKLNNNYVTDGRNVYLDGQLVEKVDSVLIN